MKKFSIIVVLFSMYNGAYGVGQSMLLEQPQQQSNQLVESARTLERWRYLGCCAWQHREQPARYKIAGCCDSGESEVPVFCALDYQALVACYACLSPGHTCDDYPSDENCDACLANAAGNGVACVFTAVVPWLFM